MYYIQIKPRSNSKRYTKTIFQTEDGNKILDYLKERQTIDPIIYQRPYMFSHIQAINTNTDTIAFIITQTVNHGHGSFEITVSPTDLANKLAI